MTKYTLLLKHPSSTVDSPVLLCGTLHDGRLKYYTGEYANKDTWYSEAQVPADKGSRVQLARITKRMDEMLIEAKVAGKPLTRSVVKRELDKLLQKNVRYLTGNYFDLMDGVIIKMETGHLLTPSKKRYSEGSLKAFRFTVNLLRSFDPGLQTGSITLETYGRFIHWCNKKNYALNYIGSQIKNWKTLGKAVGGSTIYSSPEFKKVTEETFDIYLDETELASMYDLKLSSRQDLARDWFILDCYTGLRVSDLIMLSKKNFSKGFITIANEKTGDKVVIPQHPRVKQIMEKYKGFPPVITDVEINREIKKVAKEAGIDQEVLFTITKGGKRQDFYLKKWEMVSAHTGRRSFITNLIKQGVSDAFIMKLVGMRSHQTLKRYNKMSSEEAARIMKDHDFFN